MIQKVKVQKIVDRVHGWKKGNSNTVPDMQRISMESIAPDYELFVSQYEKVVGLTNPEMVELTGKGNNNRRLAIRNALVMLWAVCDEDRNEFFGRAIEVVNFPKKSENIEYMTLRYGATEANRRMAIKASRVKGKNNPGYQHGGKFSPFSKKFVGYKTEEGAERGITETLSKSMATKELHPERDNTKIDYYLAQGLNESEAREALSERQRTFSKEICIEKYGRKKGIKVWYERQEKWLQSLNELSDDEKFRILRDKSKGSWEVVCRSNIGRPAYVYLYQMKEGLFKFGISFRPEKRYVELSKETGISVKGIELIDQVKIDCPNDAFDIETSLCEFFIPESKFSVENSLSGMSSLEYVYSDERDFVIEAWRAIIDNFKSDS